MSGDGRKWKGAFTAQGTFSSIMPPSPAKELRALATRHLSQPDPGYAHQPVPEDKGLHLVLRTLDSTGSLDTTR